MRHRIFMKKYHTIQNVYHLAKYRWLPIPSAQRFNENEIKIKFVVMILLWNWKWKSERHKIGDSHKSWRTPLPIPSDHYFDSKKNSNKESDCTVTIKYRERLFLFLFLWLNTRFLIYDIEKIPNFELNRIPSLFTTFSFQRQFALLLVLGKKASLVF